MDSAPVDRLGTCSRASGKDELARSKLIFERKDMSRRRSNHKTEVEDADEGGRTGDWAKWAATGLFLAVETEGLGLGAILGVSTLRWSRVLWRHASSLLTPLLRHNPCSRPGIVTVCGAWHCWCDAWVLVWGRDVVRVACATYSRTPGG